MCLLPNLPINDKLTAHEGAPVWAQFSCHEAFENTFYGLLSLLRCQEGGARKANERLHNHRVWKSVSFSFSVIPDTLKPSHLSWGSTCMTQTVSFFFCGSLCSFITNKKKFAQFASERVHASGLLNTVTHCHPVATQQTSPNWRMATLELIFWLLSCFSFNKCAETKYI